MLVYNTYTRDARVRRESVALVGAGHEVTVVAVLDRTTCPAETIDGAAVIRIDRRPLHYRLLWSVRRNRRRLRIAAGAIRRVADRTRGRSRPAPSSRVEQALGRPGPGKRLSGVLHRGLMRWHKPLMYADFYWRSYRRMRGTTYDAVHAHDLNTLPVAWALSRANGARLIYDAHELYPEVSTLSTLERRVWRAVEPRLIGQAKTVLTVSDSLAGELASRYDIPRPTVLLNAPDTNGIQVDRIASPLRGYCGLERSSDPILLYTGGFTPHRGLPALIRAAGLLERGVVVMLGWGRLEDELRSLIRTEGLDDRVRIVPPVPQEDLLAYAAGADIGLIPYEPVGLNNLYSAPNKLFDFLTAGIPVAASRLPEIARILGEYHIGRVFSPGDHHEIARTLNELLGDPEAMRVMRENTERARRELSWARQAEKLLAVYA